MLTHWFDLKQPHRLLDRWRLRSQVKRILGSESNIDKVSELENLEPRFTEHGWRQLDLLEDFARREKESLAICAVQVASMRSRLGQFGVIEAAMARKEQGIQEAATKALQQLVAAWRKEATERAGTSNPPSTPVAKSMAAFETRVIEGLGGSRQVRTPAPASAAAAESQPPNTPAKQISPGWLWGPLVVLILIVGLFAFLRPDDIFRYGSSNANDVRIAETATVILLVTVMAVGIERSIELLWSVQGMTRGSFWPLTLVSENVDAMADSLSDSLKDVVGKAEELAEQLKKVQERFEAKAPELTKQFDAMKANIDKLKDAKMGGERLPMLLSTVARNVSYIQTTFADTLNEVNAQETEEARNKRHAAAIAEAGRRAEEDATRQPGQPDPATARTTAEEQRKTAEDQRRGELTKAVELAWAVRTAETTVEGISDFVATFKDNPGRRLLSLYAGMAIGLVVAWLLGLDLFHAILTPVKDGQPQPLDSPYLGIVLTGLIIGLGANPTHEVIKILQEYKKSRKEANAPQTVETEPPALAGPSIVVTPPDSAPSWQVATQQFSAPSGLPPFRQSADPGDGRSRSGVTVTVVPPTGAPTHPTMSRLRVR